MTVTSLQHMVPPRVATRSIAIWLVAVATLIFAMVVLGGVTRLTRSGLSIVEWNPVMGAIPPLTEAQWTAEFDKYRQTPEYRQTNAGMPLSAFKQIYAIEWAHRLLGRIIALVFLAPLVYFAARRRIPAALTPKLIGIFVLGALQGALGWFMVRSGLIDVPHVSPYRLTAHLGLAVAIYGCVIWIVFDLLNANAPRVDNRALRRFGWLVTGMVYLMILAGGLVAGNKAGFAFNTFPLMNGHLVPPGLYAMHPAWRNIFENIAAVQFHHRLLAYALIVVASVYAWSARRVHVPARVQWKFSLLLAALLMQIGLGVATLLLIVPVMLGALHQAGALAVFTIAVRLNYDLHGI